MNSDDAFEDQLDDYFKRHARSLASWRFITRDTGIEKFAVELTAILLEQINTPNACPRPRLERRVASIISRAYLQGCDHAIDFVRDEGYEELAQRMSLRV